MVRQGTRTAGTSTPAMITGPHFTDVILYFNRMTWIAINEPASVFDYNGNGRIDFADVVWLFNNL